MLPARNASLLGSIAMALLLTDKGVAAVAMPECLEAQVLAISGKWLANPGARALAQWSCLKHGEEVVIAGRRVGEITVIYRRGSIAPHTEKCETSRDCRNAYTIETAVTQASPEPYIKSLLEEFFKKREPRVVPGILQGSIRQPSPADDISDLSGAAGTGAAAAGAAAAAVAGISASTAIIPGVTVAGLGIAAAAGAFGRAGRVGAAITAGVVVTTVGIRAIYKKIRAHRESSQPVLGNSFIPPAVVCEQGGQVDLSRWWPRGPVATNVVELTPIRKNAVRFTADLRWKLDNITELPALFEVRGNRATAEGITPRSFVLVAPQSSCQTFLDSLDNADRFISAWPKNTPAAAAWNLKLVILTDLAGLPGTGLH